MTRPTVNAYFLNMAFLVASRATCARRQVGCVLVNQRNHVIATGYNGNAAGLPNCINEPCKGAGFPSGQGLEFCEAIHAEANALLQCHDVYAIEKAFCTASPCIHCVKLLLNTSCKEIVFLEEYPHPDAKALWEKAGRRWNSDYTNLTF